jgi:hypothetical protein
MMRGYPRGFEPNPSVGHLDDDPVSLAFCAYHSRVHPSVPPHVCQRLLEASADGHGRHGRSYQRAGRRPVDPQPATPHRGAEHLGQVDFICGHIDLADQHLQVTTGLLRQPRLASAHHSHADHQQRGCGRVMKSSQILARFGTSGRRHSRIAAGLLTLGMQRVRPTASALYRHKQPPR